MKWTKGKSLLTSTVLCAGLFTTSAFAADKAMKRSTSGLGVEDRPEVVEAWGFYLEMVDREATSVYFDKGSSTLTALEKTRIQDRVKALKDDKMLDEVVVASWSDKPYPAANEKLSDADKSLADKRNDAVKSVLRDAGVKSLDAYSMAEKPNWFQKVFGTDAAQVKGVAKDHGIDGKDEAHIAKILARRGGPSRSVIIFRTEKYKTSMSGR